MHNAIATVSAALFVVGLSNLYPEAALLVGGVGLVACFVRNRL